VAVGAGEGIVVMLCTAAAASAFSFVQKTSKAKEIENHSRANNLNDGEGGVDESEAD